MGATIEHAYKEGTYPPQDFEKRARICEHIILHYTQGWADGFHYDIEYWEIWNEPDCKDGDGTNPCWQGTEEQFAAFFTAAFRPLKSRFPKLKFGGPAMCSVGSSRFVSVFFESLQKAGVVLDFYSFHCYTADPHDLTLVVEKAKEQFETYGQSGAELILNEYNYVENWEGEGWLETIRKEKGIEGASFTAAAMCLMQHSPLAMLMYYDARPCGMNGLFATDTFAPLKGYYALKMFNELYRLGTAVNARSDDAALYLCAAKDGAGKGAALFTYFPVGETGAKKETKIVFGGMNEGKKKVVFFLLNEENDCKPVREETVVSQDAAFYLTLQPDDVFLVCVTPAENG